VPSATALRAPACVASGVSSVAVGFGALVDIPPVPSSKRAFSREVFKRGGDRRPRPEVPTFGPEGLAQGVRAFSQRRTYFKVSPVGHYDPSRGTPALGWTRSVATPGVHERAGISVDSVKSPNTGTRETGSL
jgi:hypothetical protein